MTKHLYPVTASVAKAAHTNSADYQTLYQESVETPERFWERQGKCLDWIKPYSTVKNSSFANDNVHISWYSDGELNACVNCVDRHLATKATQTAIIWEGDEASQTRKISYQELHEQVCMMANVLKANRVAKGDCVTIYMPMIPEAIFAMLACARVGAIHCVVFGGFSPDSLAGRIVDCDSSFVITADGGFRGGKHVALKDNVDLALEQCPKVHSVLVIRHSSERVSWDVDRDMWWENERRAASDICEPEVMNAEDPLFILYTSGSTGKPKGILHSTGGYLVYASVTYHHIFDYKEGEVYWCTADLGWITGHSYILYGPLLNAATTLLFEGVPSYPDPSRFWQVVDKHEVNVFYTAPTALRSLIREGNSWVNQTSRESLRILGSVGEPINPEAWEWFHEIVGGGRCPIVDTWWQTETGGVLISPLPGATDLKPGAAGKPFFGVRPGIVDNEGRTLEGEAEGNLVILDSWPGQMRSIYGDHQRFVDTYFTTFPGKYCTGDGAKRDADGYYWITGRVDDVLNVSGHRMGTAEVESALVAHPSVAEAAVVGFPHDLKGQGIYAYVTLMNNQDPSESLRKALVSEVKQRIGPIAAVDHIQWVPALPKTRSGKIMRRILRKIAEKDFLNLGDISTLADPSVVSQLIDGRSS